jgi:inosose dehydratase
MPFRPDRLGNAPVSYGVLAATDRAVEPPEVLGHIRSAGYAGSEVGPHGYWPSGGAAARAFAEAGLHPIGSYCPVRLDASAAELAEDLARVTAVAAALATCGQQSLLILAGTTTPELRMHPARRPDEARFGLDDGGWDRAAEILGSCAAVAGRAGIGVSLHPHMCTYIETLADVDRLFERVELPLTLDTGHAAAAGDDPLRFWRRWRASINHIHLKDIRQASIARARAAGVPFAMMDAAVALGTGDVDLAPLLEALAADGYPGWIVVEQDLRLGDGDPAVQVGRAAEDQRANREFLRAWARDAAGSGR